MKWSITIFKLIFQKQQTAPRTEHVNTKLMGHIRIRYCPSMETPEQMKIACAGSLTISWRLWDRAGRPVRLLSTFSPLSSSWNEFCVCNSSSGGSCISSPPKPKTNPLPILGFSVYKVSLVTFFTGRILLNLGFCGDDCRYPALMVCMWANANPSNRYCLSNVYTWTKAISAIFLVYIICL